MPRGVNRQYREGNQIRIPLQLVRNPLQFSAASGVELTAVNVGPRWSGALLRQAPQGGGCPFKKTNARVWG